MWFFLIGAAMASELPVVFKKGMIITCPKNQEPVYKVIETIREGEPVTSKNVIEVSTGKAPIKGQPFKCDSVISTWRGVCISSNQGFLPKACQEGLRISLEFEPQVE